MKHVHVPSYSESNKITCIKYKFIQKLYIEQTKQHITDNFVDEIHVYTGGACKRQRHVTVHV